VAREALAAGERGLARFSVQLLRPVQPMLADSAAGPDEALARVGEAAIEFKIDGARI
jgi:DNA ligase-1